MARYQGRFLRPEDNPKLDSEFLDTPLESSSSPEASVQESNQQIPEDETVAPRPRRERPSARSPRRQPRQTPQAAPDTENASPDQAHPGLEAKSAARHNANAAAKKKAWWMDQLWLLLFLLVSAAVPELLLHFATADGWEAAFNSGLILSVLFAVVPALLIFALICLISHKIATRIITVGYAFIAYLLCASQVVYYKIFGCFYSAFSMTHGGAAFQFWTTILTSIGKNIVVLLLMALPLLFSIVFWRRVVPHRCKWRRAFAVVPAAAAIVLQLVLVLLLPIFGGTGDMSAYDLYHKNTDAYYSVNKLGLGTAFRLDLTRLLTGNSADGGINLPAGPTPSGPAPSDTNDTNSSGTTNPDDSTPPESTDAPLPTGPNVLDFDFETLIANETDSKIKEVHQYFLSRTPSNKNEKTGMFEGCNLILICAEGFDYLAVTEERTPTLYKLMHEGFYFTDYYVPNWGVSTTDGEYGFLTGTVPKAGTWSFRDSASNAMPLTMCAQLLDLGYSAYAYHGHTYSYYNRNEYLENLGYIYRAYGQGLDVKKTWPESDVEVIDLTTADYVNSEPFTAYYMTISGHMNYTFSGNYIASKNRDLVADEPYSSNVKAYLATQLELEASMTLLLERLEEAGVLDNTVIVLTADHYPYGLTDDEISELLGHQVETNFEIYKNGCIIYKPGMTPETIDTPCSHLDLLPTLSNLFGLDFDSRLYMGRDVFSDAEPLVMFRNRSWITDKASYNASTKEVISKTETPVSDDYVKSISTELNNRFTVSSRILDYNYWKILYPYS